MNARLSLLVRFIFAIVGTLLFSSGCVVGHITDRKVKGFSDIDLLNTVLTITPEKYEGYPGEKIAVHVELKNTSNKASYLPLKLEDWAPIESYDSRFTFDRSGPVPYHRLEVKVPADGTVTYDTTITAPNELGTMMLTTRRVRPTGGDIAIRIVPKKPTSFGPVNPRVADRVNPTPLENARRDPSVTALKADVSLLLQSRATREVFVPLAKRLGGTFASIKDVESVGFELFQFRRPGVKISGFIIVRYAFDDQGKLLVLGIDEGEIVSDIFE